MEENIIKSLKTNTPIGRWDYAFISIGIFSFINFIFEIIKILTPFIFYKLDFAVYVSYRTLSFFLSLFIFYIFSVASIRRFFDISGSKKKAFGFFVLFLTIFPLSLIFSKLADLLFYGILIFLITKKGQLTQSKDFQWNKVKTLQASIIGIYILCSLLFNLNFTKFIAKGNDMAPIIKRRDEFLVRNLKKEELKRGELIVYKDKNRTYYQRIIALPGEKIEIKRDSDNIANIYINDKILSEPYKKLKEYSPHPKAKHYVKTLIAKNSYFVLGDNRDMSYDSRFLGPINKNKIIGKIIYIYYPTKRIKFFKD